MKVPPDQPRRVGTIWTMDLRQPPSVVIQPLVQVSFRRLEPESAQAAAEAAAHSGMAESQDSALEEINRRFERGRWCYAAWAGEKVAAYGWVSFEAEYVGELDLTLRIATCEAYIWDCATVPAFRQKRLYSALLSYIAGELHGEGLTRAWIGADMDNQPSQRGIDRAGFQRVADLALTMAPSKERFLFLPYPGVSQQRAAEARRLFLGEAV